MEDQRMSNCYYVCRWSWLGAACLTTSTRAITWRWRSSSAWSFLRAEACLCPRELSTKTGHPRLHRRRTLRHQNQVGREGNLEEISFPAGSRRMVGGEEGWEWMDFLFVFVRQEEDEEVRDGRKGLGDRKERKRGRKRWRKGRKKSRKKKEKDLRKGRTMGERMIWKAVKVKEWQRWSDT